MPEKHIIFAPLKKLLYQRRISYTPLQHYHVIKLNTMKNVVSWQQSQIHHHKYRNLNTYLSRLNFRECRIAGIFCLRFHRWMLSSAKALTSAPYGDRVEQKGQ